MYYSTTDVYATKRKIVNYAKSLVTRSNKVEAKFVSQLIYGILRSGSVILKDIAVSLNEEAKVENTIDRLSGNLKRQLSSDITESYRQKMVNNLPEDPLILVDDSDVIKPYGVKFEALGKVRDGSDKNKRYEKGYMVTEIVGLTSNKKQPVGCQHFFGHSFKRHSLRVLPCNDLAIQLG